MLIKILLLIALIIGGALFLRWLFRQPRRAQLRWLLYFLAGGIVILALTGRIHWVGAVFAGLILVAKKLFLVARFIPGVGRFISLIVRIFNRRDPSHGGDADSAYPTNDATMSREEALEVLNLHGDPTREEIILAHKRLMQKMHPDRGGSDYLAKKINRAKDCLLKDSQQ